MLIALAFVLGCLAGAVGALRVRRAPVVAALPAPAPTLVVRDYRITRDGKLLWAGVDGQEAKLWWEHAKAQPGTASLAFYQDGIPRDAFTLRAS